MENSSVCLEDSELGVGGGTRKQTSDLEKLLKSMLQCNKKFNSILQVPGE